MSLKEFKDKEICLDGGGFLKYRLVLQTLAFVVVCGGLYFGCNVLNTALETSSMGFSVISPWYIITPFFIISLWKALDTQTQYKKTKYTLYKDRIIYQGGRILSDFENELNYKNVTRVSLIIPFVENYFCATGRVLVESAGAAKTEVSFISVADPKTLYLEIIENLKNNGFKLAKDNLIQQERPHPLAVFMETAQMISGLSLYAFYFLFFDGNDLEESTAMPWIYDHVTFSLIAGSIFLLGLGVYGTVFYLGLKRRVYSLYDDTIEYHEGFLTKVTSIIPMENLADSSVTQGFVSKLFGLYDVKLSCQGSNQDISFRNIANGQLLSENLDKQINIFRNQNSIVEMKNSDALEDPSQTINASKTQTQTTIKNAINYDKTSTLDLKIDRITAWIPTIGFFILCYFGMYLGFKKIPLEGFGIFCMSSGVVSIVILIYITFTKYRIKESSVESTFNFLNRKTTEFSFEKVTGVIFKRSIVERCLGTQTVVFTSIGAGHKLVLHSVRIDDGIKAMIMGKCGMRTNVSAELHRIGADFSFISMLCAHIFSFSFLGVAVLTYSMFFPYQTIIVIVVLAVLIGTIVIIASMYYKRSQLIFYKDHIQLTFGLINLSHQCALYEDIKDVTTVKFPMMDKGLIKFNIAGEFFAGQTKDRRGAQAYISNVVFKFNYTDSITYFDEFIDSVFIMKRSANATGSTQMTKPLAKSFKDSLTARSAFANPVFIGVVFGVCLLLPGVVISWVMNGNTGIIVLVAELVLLAILVGVIMLKTYMMQYAIQDNRVLAKSGIFYKKQTTIIFDRIDFINSHQGVLNKMFNNGTVTINTAGSSRPEITVKNISNYREFYKELKSVYK
ncbi:MAG: membrane protein YdbS with pleckstrin-like domain [Candidatus Omnitrophota bacterium]|jgi:membrane protein YdbS with pleckstrin-like domain